MLPAPLDFNKWIADNRHLLKPPVANKCIYAGDFIVMVVGGPNARKDYHVDPGAELFYQLEGAMVLKTQQGGKCVDIPIKAGEMFLLPEWVPHSPQRMAGGIGLVVERRRMKGEHDALQWYCEQLQPPAARGALRARRHRDPVRPGVRALLRRPRQTDLPRPAAR